MADPALGLELAKRSVALAPKDAESLEILAEAYWRNGDRAAAVQSMEQSLALIEPTPTPARKAFEKTLAEYRTAPLLKH
jgi:Flp pilus assembly protein TadD